jgi:hypothetical protein
VRYPLPLRTLRKRGVPKPSAGALGQPVPEFRFEALAQDDSWHPLPDFATESAHWRTVTTAGEGFFYTPTPGAGDPDAVPAGEPPGRGAQPGEASGMTTQPSLYSRHRFTAEIISHAV